MVARTCVFLLRKWFPDSAGLASARSMTFLFALLPPAATKSELSNRSDKSVNERLTNVISVLKSKRSQFEKARGEIETQKS